jgi:molybdopterin-binding protein/molybdate transport repressor ModE-like protein
VRRDPREAVLTPLDLRLLAALEEEGNLVRACRRIGISRDRAIYRIARLARAEGALIVSGRRGGRTAGGTALTPHGRRLLRRGRPALVLGRTPLARSPALDATVLRGTFRSGPPARVELDSGRSLYVGFRMKDGVPLSVAIDPESVLIAPRPVLSSARNSIRGIVRTVRPIDAVRSRVEVDVEGTVVGTAVTPESILRLRLRPGARVYLLMKATAIRPLMTPPPFGRAPP